MTTPHTEAAERNVLIIHHLSDLHFQQAPQSAQTPPGDQAALVRYAQYLLGQPRNKRPSIVVITGDLTANGNRNELETVASNLKIAFPEWSGNLKQHIYVVPGPHDVCWTGTKPPSFKEFYEVFGEFALPSQNGTIPDNLLAPQTVPYRVYPLNTTYTPDLPLGGIEMEHRGHLKHYRRFRLTYRARWWQRKRRTEALRKLFLDLTEGNELTILDAGMIDKRDLAAFLSWKPNESSGSHIMESLKILVTHHPLLIHPDFKAETPKENEITKRFHTLLEAARKAKFHLAFHGHLHKPQVLSDLSITEGTDIQHSMQQIGAGSLGDKGTFNEIVATYDDSANLWRFEIRTIGVQSTQSTTSPSLVLMNPDKDPIKRTAELRQTLQRRQRFEQEIRTVMRQFSESVESEKLLDPRSLSHVGLPQVAMSSIERIIREIIFLDEYDVRVALALKAVDPTRHIVELRNTYIVPPLEGEPRTLFYPASVASWALILGRTLLYPAMADTALQPEDIAWITQNNKLTAINQALDSLIQEASDFTVAKGRYENLKNALKDLGSRPLYIRDLFQPTPTGQLQPYPFFAAVPIPLRSQTSSAGLPEIGALDISLRERKKDGLQGDQAANDREEMFSKERLDMLETLADLCTQILCSADALERPKGSWSDWIRK